MKNDSLIVILIRMFDNYEHSASNEVYRTFKGEKEFVIQVVKRNGKYLEYISPNLRNDRDVIEAVRHTHG